MTPVFFQGWNISVLDKCILYIAYKYVTKSKYINKTETETNDLWYQSSFMTFYNTKLGFFYSNTTYQSLINWPLLRGYFGSLECTVHWGQKWP